MAFEDYVRGEIVAGCADGRLTRREAVRRLRLLGIGTATAAATTTTALPVQRHRRSRRLGTRMVRPLPVMSRR